MFIQVSTEICMLAHGLSLKTEEWKTASTRVPDIPERSMIREAIKSDIHTRQV